MVKTFVNEKVSLLVTISVAYAYEYEKIKSL